MNSEVFAFVIPGILIIIALLLFVPIKRSTNKPADGRPIGSIFRDDARYWYGFLYYNPDDPDVLIPKRYGIGWTINFGHPAGRLFAIIMLILLLLPLVMFFIPGLS